jgi:dephospho-CoA kinase
MKRIGLTGGIATGKSRVANILVSNGIPVLDADQVARDVVAPGTPGLQALIGTFGPTVLQEDGSLDRGALGELVMADADARKTLEAITHPLIFMACQAWFRAREREDHGAAVLEAALMVETGSWKLYDAVIVVSCEPETQRERLMRREAMDREVAERWIGTQMPIADKAKVADAVVHNLADCEAAGGAEVLGERVMVAWRQALEAAGA